MSFLICPRMHWEESIRGALKLPSSLSPLPALSALLSIPRRSPDPLPGRIQMVPDGLVPADWAMALEDCKGDANCMALGAK